MNSRPKSSLNWSRLKIQKPLQCLKQTRLPKDPKNKKAVQKGAQTKEVLAECASNKQLHLKSKINSVVDAEAPKYFSKATAKNV